MTDYKVDAKARRVTITTTKGTVYTAEFEIISTKMSPWTIPCQACEEVKRLHEVRVMLLTRGTPTVLLAICGDCLVDMENGKKVKGRGAQALPGDNGPIRVDRPAAGEEAVQGTDDGGRDPPPHPPDDHISKTKE